MAAYSGFREGSSKAGLRSKRRVRAAVSGRMSMRMNDVRAHKTRSEPCHKL
jgi:hypothetical protein